MIEHSCRTTEGPLKILLLSHAHNDKNGGASRIYHILEAGLKAKGHDLSVLHYEDFRPIRLPKIQRIIDRLAFPQFVHCRTLASGGVADVVMSSSGMGVSLFNRLKKRTTRPLLVSHIHGLSLFDHQANLNESMCGRLHLSAAYKYISAPMTLKWEETCARLADVTVVQNDRDADFLCRSHMGIKVEKVEPGLYDEVCSSVATPNIEVQESNSLLWFGSWTARKGNAALPAAFDLVLDAIPDARLTIGGANGSEIEIRSAFSHRANGRLCVLPKITVEEQVRQYRRHALFLFPSLSEGFGLALLEAMSAGMPVITTDTGLGGDFLEHNRNAYIIPKGNALHLARAVVRLLCDNNLRARLAAEGQRHAMLFTSERMVEKYEDLFMRHRADLLAKISQ